MLNRWKTDLSRCLVRQGSSTIQAAYGCRREDAVPNTQELKKPPEPATPGATPAPWGGGYHAGGGVGCDAGACGAGGVAPLDDDDEVDAAF